MRTTLFFLPLLLAATASAQIPDGETATEQFHPVITLRVLPTLNSTTQSGVDVGCPCAYEASGKATTARLGISSELSLVSWMSVGAGIAFLNEGVTFIATSAMLPLVNESGEIFYFERQSIKVVRLEYLAAGLFTRVRPFGNSNPSISPYFVLGADWGSQVSGWYRESERLVGDSVKFNDGTKEYVSEEHGRVERNGSLGLSVAIGCDFMLDPQWSIAPQVGIDQRNGPGHGSWTITNFSAAVVTSYSIR